jgi:hypothetical protein
MATMPKNARAEGRPQSSRIMMAILGPVGRLEHAPQDYLAIVSNPRIQIRKHGSALLVAAALLSGCGARSALATASPTVNPSVIASTDPDVQAVSLSATSGIAGVGLTKCSVAGYVGHVAADGTVAQVAGIGIVAHGSLVKNYVDLSGKEPELKTDDPAFVVQYSGTIRELTLGGPGSAGWIDITNAICVVVDDTPYFYVTGSWVDAIGARGSTPPGPFQTKDLPAPLP